MEKIKVAMLIAPMGHDVHRMSLVTARWLEQTGLFTIEYAGQDRLCRRSIDEFFADEDAVRSTGLFLCVCPDWPFDPASRARLEQAVSDGTPIMFHHGLHPAYRNWEGGERMVGLLWRDTASHGDFGPCSVRIEKDHPITQGLEDFTTREELFCGLTNVWGVELETLVTGFSDKGLISRHGAPGTGNREPLLTLGHYGKGITVDFLMGHVWPYYTGHGLLENTLVAFEPPEVRKLLTRAAEWATRGCVEYTL